MLPNTSKHPLLPICPWLSQGQVTSYPVGLWGRHWFQVPGPGTADKVPTWASYLRNIHSSLVTHYPAMVPPLPGGPEGVLGFQTGVE